MPVPSMPEKEISATNSMQNLCRYFERQNRREKRLGGSDAENTEPHSH
jgi:hypothetical protein